MAYEVFKIWYAASLANNTFAQADANFRIENTTTPTGEEISLIYCLPGNFAKRQTDVSEALSEDPTSPDTGTAASDVILRFSQKREAAPVTSPVLDKLINMFYSLSSDSDFRKGRFGLETSDNPKLDVLPTATAGYKFLSFKQEPNQNTQALEIFEVRLKFVGDHTLLGTRS